MEIRYAWAVALHVDMFVFVFFPQQVFFLPKSKRDGHIIRRPAGRHQLWTLLGYWPSRTDRWITNATVQGQHRSLACQTLYSVFAAGQSTGTFLPSCDSNHRLLSRPRFVVLFFSFVETPVLQVSATVDNEKIYANKCTNVSSIGRAEELIVFCSFSSSLFLTTPKALDCGRIPS